MAHVHASHSHVHSASADRGRLQVALALIAGFIVVEIATGVIAHSLALLSDAGHMLTDAAAIGFSLVALSLAARPARGALTFGFSRAEALSAQANGVTLLVLAAFITYEGIARLVHPPKVHAGLMLAVALAGVVVNLAATWTLSRADRASLSIEGSFQHLLTDLYGFIGTAIAAGVILASGFDRADAIASLLIAALMTRSAGGLLKASARVFLESSPRGVSPQQVGEALAACSNVVEVHDLHVWEISHGFTALSAHALVRPESDCHAARRAMEEMLRERFGIGHTTLQVDHVDETLLEISPVSRAGVAGEHR
ncbi:MAG TPA: cation diffusion facilitator family transporter [Solirubrobacteraceae bacterium]|nr:cation diffusion facilitator family transporter [Solirubrobacteraceae bacterium]